MSASSAAGYPWRPANSREESKSDPATFLHTSQIASLARTVILEEMEAITTKLQSQTVAWDEKTIKQLVERLTLLQMNLTGLLAFIDNNVAEAISISLAYYHSPVSDTKMGVMNRPLVELSSKGAGPYEGSSGISLMTSPFCFPASGTPDFQATNTSFVLNNTEPGALKLPAKNETGRRSSRKSNRGRHRRVEPFMPTGV